VSIIRISKFNNNYQAEKEKKIEKKGYKEQVHIWGMKSELEVEKDARMMK
jgi:hypothetical protein